MTETPAFNRLGSETSPYLLQHKDNPVNWWPWGPEALAAAKATGKPILLSIGYAACHWCHVMAHESFEDAETARLMNDSFINIKVDREERPDIDAIYMLALLRLSDHGGWPLTMFLDADAKPFWGGTYFPPEEVQGRPSFRRVLQEITRIYRDEPGKVRQNVEAITASLAARPAPATDFELTTSSLVELARKAVSIMDPVHGGIHGRPKFPQWGIFTYLWRMGIAFDIPDARDAVTTFLRNICQGGIYDHLGGGFARYSVDERWLVPHFEKMLYDNALLIELLTEAWRETHDPLFKQRITETVTWLEREMIAEGGGFAASLDADSEGKEGKYYVWTEQEILSALGETAGRFFSSVYDVTGTGNFEGQNILNRLGSMDPLSPGQERQLETMRAKMLTIRERRLRPGWDDKVLADWNGLAVAALARAALVFDRPDWRTIADRAFWFVADNMVVEGRLMHASRAGKLRATATASDYANMIRAALRLYEHASDRRYLDQATAWTAIINRQHRVDNGGYATTADDTDDVIVRLLNASDDATPNANAIMTTNLVELFLLTGELDYLERARAVVVAFTPELAERMFGHFGLLAGHLSTLHPEHIAIAATGDATATSALAKAVTRLSLPGAIVHLIPPGHDRPQPKPPLAGKPTAYVCVGTDCAPPISDPAQLSDHLLTARRIS